MDGVMAAPGRYRDSTQIVLPQQTLEGLRRDLKTEFRVTLHNEGRMTRIIGSPVVIKDVSDFLIRHGISLP